MRGFTPSVIDLPVGDHAVEIAADGREPFKTRIAIRKDDRTFVEARLRYEQPRVAAAQKCDSDNAINQSKHSRRIVPITRSQTRICLRAMRR